MIPLNSALCAVRYGYGLAPGQTPPDGPQALLAGLSQPDPFADDPKHIDLDERMAFAQEMFAALRLRRTDPEGGNKRVEELAPKFRKFGLDDNRNLIRHAVEGGDFRERLVTFWRDHFTVAANNRQLKIAVYDHVHSAVRPHVAGNFADMLRAVSTHPAMLIFLNQSQSVGPNSTRGQNRNQGLNENLAREILELHTLGVSGSYTQDDVRQFAELLTGMTVGAEGFVFRRGWAEPGTETVLGREYGGDPAQMDHILEALNDIAMHPDTASHLARKLIVHFIGGEPDADYVDFVATAYLASGGDLTTTYRAMLEDDRAWQPQLLKVKLPFDYIVSGLRALGLTGDDIDGLDRSRFNAGILGQMNAMGQRLMTPNGPDGWAEDPEDWITPQGLAARVQWSAEMARRLGRDRDPRAFLEATLGPLASPLLTGAVSGSETKNEGVALVLASPEFNRR